MYMKKFSEFLNEFLIFFSSALIKWLSNGLFIFMSKFVKQNVRNGIDFFSRIVYNALVGCNLV